MKWLLIALIVIGGFLAIIFTSGGGNGGGGGGKVSAINSGDWIKGNAQATVELIEFSDFQCPACKSMEPILSSVIDEFGNHMKFAYRHLPLKAIHGNSENAAKASEAAGFQGKFWEMHDKIFENQALWSPMSKDQAVEAFASYAQELGLDVEKFKKDFESREVADAVEQDADEAASAAIQSTPTFFLNGERIQPRNLENFRTLVKDAIQNT